MSDATQLAQQLHKGSEHPIDATVPARSYTSVIGLNCYPAVCWDHTRSSNVSQVRGLDGSVKVLADGLAGADLVVMVSAMGGDGRAVAAIGKACRSSGMMTAGLVLPDGRRDGSALSALRPLTRVLVTTPDESDVAALFLPLRA